MRKKAGRAASTGRPAHLGDDERFGTGLWRHNRDRFIRAVDRYYTTAVSIHEARAGAPEPGTASAGAPEPGAPESVATENDPVNTIVDGTHRLNELVTLVDAITERLHADHPVTGQVVPGLVRQAIGDTPELLTKASAKVAEAVLAASMARTEILAGKPIGSGARATARFIDDAAELLERAQANLDKVEES
ncbi:hypothetical protein CV023_12025 [Brevibacterium sp. CCUG 69071]|nr:hypothetical protein [Brevibacterium sp. CCUG 69071]